MNSDFWIKWDRVTLRDREERGIFTGTNWVWRPGEVWAVLGANGAGKHYFASALTQRVPPLAGSICLNLPPPPACIEIAALANRKSVVLISPEVHRHILTSESSFYQARWHNGLEEGGMSASDFLSRQYVEDINPFEVGMRGATPEDFDAKREEFLEWMGIAPELLGRKWTHLSNGEQRKMILIHALLHAPQMLVLEEPFGGLDVQTRSTLLSVMDRLMKASMPVLPLVSRPDELPPSVSHLLLLEKNQVIAQGPIQEVLKHPVACKLASPPIEVRTSQSVRSRRSVCKSFPPIPSGVDPVVELNEVTFKMEEKVILDRINWKIYPGENWVLQGPNGAGKTSLLSLIQGDHPLAYSLNIRVMGESYHSTRSLWLIRQQMGWVSPELCLHYPGDWTCKEVVSSGFFHSMGLHTLPTGPQEERTHQCLEELGLSHLAEYSFGEVSMGDQRLVLLARAWVNRPRLLILDEPCQGLDASYRTRLLDAVDANVAQTKCALIFVTHEANEIPACINRTLCLHAGKGKVVEEGGFEAL